MSFKKSRMIWQALWKYRRIVIVGVVALLIVDLAELVPPILIKEAIDSIQSGKPSSSLLPISFLVLLVALFQMGGRFGWRKTLVRTSMLSGRDFRNEYVEKLFSLSTSFFDRKKTGDLISIGISDVEAVRMAIGPGFILFLDAMFFIVTIPVAMWWLSPDLTLLTFLTLPLMPFLVFKFEKKIQERFQKVQEAAARLASLAQENLMGIRLIKANAREDAQIELFRKQGEEYARLSQSFAWVQQTLGPTLDFVMSLGLVTLLIFGGPKVLSGVVSLGTFVAFQRYIHRLVWPMSALGLAVTYHQRGLISSERVQEIHREQNDTPDPPKPILPGPHSTRGKIEVRNLSFTFPNTKKEVLHGITFTAEPGERIGIAGRVGAGKSALLSLFPRLYPVPKGTIFFDGVDVRDWPGEALRDRIGYVGQDLFLFSETVFDNVGWGSREDLLPIRDFEESFSNPVEPFARYASIHDEILLMPKRYGTEIGERGSTLSGGQRQRLALARALARNPVLLILDDALSGVDSETEEKVLDRLRSREPKATEFVASHRISAIEEADRVLVLDEGRIAQQGTHKTLLKMKSGLYRKIYDQQALEKEADAYQEQIQQSE